jgi:DNA-binding NtrC family response regulator
MSLDQAHNTTSPDAKQALNMNGARIMVVDDEHALVSMLYDFLSMYGAQVDTYTNPLQALTVFTQQADAIDLVITDQTMPGMSGMHLSGSMLKLKPQIPIILCTGYCKHANAGSAAQAGIAAFFNKPVKMAELIGKVQSLLPRKSV